MYNFTSVSLVLISGFIVWFSVTRKNAHRWQESAEWFPAPAIFCAIALFMYNPEFEKCCHTLNGGWHLIVGFAGMITIGWLVLSFYTMAENVTLFKEGDWLLRVPSR